MPDPTGTPQLDGLAQALRVLLSTIPEARATAILQHAIAEAWLAP